MHTSSHRRPVTISCSLRTENLVMSTPGKYRFRIAVCGGGIAGLALAVTLGRYEDPAFPIEIHIYERGSEISTFGAGISVWQRTWRVMHLLGIDEELAKASVKPPTKDIGPGFVYRRADRLEDTYNYYTVMLPYGSSTMHRADMMDVLRRNLPASCSIHTSKRLDKYTEVTDERGIVTAIELHFTDGSIVETDVLIGADGIKSATRATLYDIAHRKECSQEIDKHSCSRCAMATPKWSGTVAYRCLIPTEKLRQVNPEHQAFGFTLCYSGKGKHVVSYPVSHGSFINFIGFSTLGKEGAAYEGKWVQEMPKEDLVKHYVGWEREVQEMLQCVEESSRWAIHMVISLPFSVSDRVALLGDAMHAMETHLGAGAGQSIEDAYILGRLLAHPLTTLSRVSEVLRIYQSIRLPFAHTIQQRARETGRMCEFNGPGHYGGEECHDERERLAELGEALYRQWKWQWEEPFDEQWELAEKAMGRFARADGQIECV